MLVRELLTAYVRFVPRADIVLSLDNINKDNILIIIGSIIFFAIKNGLGLLTNKYKIQDYTFY